MNIGDLIIAIACGGVFALMLAWFIDKKAERDYPDDWGMR